MDYTLVFNLLLQFGFFKGVALSLTIRLTNNGDKHYKPVQTKSTNVIHTLLNKRAKLKLQLRMSF